MEITGLVETTDSAAILQRAMGFVSQLDGVRRDFDLLEVDYMDMGYAYHAIPVAVRESATVCLNHRELTAKHFEAPGGISDAVVLALLWRGGFTMHNLIAMINVSPEMFGGTTPQYEHVRQRCQPFIEAVRGSVRGVDDQMSSLAGAVQAMMQARLSYTPPTGPRKRTQDRLRVRNLLWWIHSLPRVREGLVTSDHVFAEACQYARDQCEPGADS